MLGRPYRDKRTEKKFHKVPPTFSSDLRLITIQEYLTIIQSWLRYPSDSRPEATAACLLHSHLTLTGVPRKSRTNHSSLGRRPRVH
jgi:hypothetical protein